MSTPTRTQTRTTQTPGDPVPDQFWTITSDTNPNGLPGPSTGGKLNVVAVTASGNDGNLPSNVIDGNLNTRWSSFGKGQNITLDLGASASITEVDVAWYKGDTRKNNFVIDVSQDNTNFTNFFSGTSSGTTLQFEKYSGVGSGRYVRVTVNGNTLNDWASITEIQAIGAGGGSTPTCPSGQHWDPTTNQCVPDTTGGGGTGTPQLDVFGIQKVYADMPGTYNYWDQKDNTRWFEQKPVATSGGWWTYPNLTQGRIEVLPVAGLKDTDIDTFHMDTLIKRGYTHKPNNSPDGKGDWGGPGVGLECTVRYRNVSLGSGSFEAHPEWVWGTFRQSGHGAPSMPLSCQAGSYHANIYYGSNRAHFERDMRHTDGYIAHNPEVKGVIGINGKAEHVHKAIFWTQPNPSVPGSGGLEVHLEHYLSTDGGKTFKLLQHYVDDGHMGPLKTPGAGTACGYASDEQPISNAKCCPGIRIDFMNSFEFRDMSIRTVDFTKKLIP